MAATRLQALGLNLEDGDVLVHYLRCRVKDYQTGQIMEFYSRPTLLECALTRHGIPRNAHVGLQELDTEAHNLLLTPALSRA